MAFFRKKEAIEKPQLPELPQFQGEGLPELPPLPPLPELRRMEPSMRAPETRAAVSMAPLPAKASFAAKEPIFVKLDKFKEVVEKFEEVKRKVNEIDESLKRVKEVKEKEGSHALGKHYYEVLNWAQMNVLHLLKNGWGSLQS